MTVRIAKILGLQEILDLSKKLNIYDEIPELLSMSLGAAETTLMNLTSAYAPFVNGGKKIEPTLISRIQDRRGNTIFKSENRNCVGCDKFSLINQNELPKILDTSEDVISEATAYQMISILKGAVERGTAKKLNSLKVPLAGKTGTTNDNYDAWFIGFSSDLVIGVYVGFDNPRTLGKFEPGGCGTDQTSIIVGVRDQVGAMHKVVESFAKNHVSLRRFESRPARTTRVHAWEYLFYIDLEGHINDTKVKKALDEVKENSVFFKNLGSYPLFEKLGLPSQLT